MSLTFFNSIRKKAATDNFQVVMFSSTAIALYGYDQGMMSLINTNKDYLRTMGLEEESPQVGVIVSVYYLGCAVGAVLFSTLADRNGRKPALFGCLAMASLGNLIMFIAGLGYSRGALAVMYLGRVIMGLGVGGVDSVVPVYSSELSSDGARGKALAQEFQSNIFGLNMAFAINLAATVTLGKYNEWAWRVPIIAMQIYPLGLLAFIKELPESPRWFIYHDREEDAKASLADIMGDEDVDPKCKELVESHKQEQDSGASVGYIDMLTPGHDQFHPTVITIMGQVNQALTGYGAVSVYGPQIFELLGYGVRKSEYLTQANYVSYFIMMTFAWLLIDAVGRRSLMVWGSVSLTLCFVLLTVFGGLVEKSDDLDIPTQAVAIPGIVVRLHSLPLEPPTHTTIRPITPSRSKLTKTTDPLPSNSNLRHSLARLPLADPHRNLPHDRSRAGNRHFRDNLGPRQLRRNPPHPDPLQQPRLQAFRGLRRHEPLRRSLDLYLHA
jgi:MFS family permease